MTPAASPKAADKAAKGEKDGCERALEKPLPPQSRRKKQPGPCGSSGGQARADFNGDGFADLAVGVPNESVGAVESAGAVQVIYGSTAGLTTVGNQLWTQDSPDLAEEAESVDRFGEALAAGDFDGDGFADLAVGAPGEDLGPSVDAGAVNVIYGSAAGLTAFGDQLWHQGSDGVEDQIEPFDQFGASLLWANFGKGSQADLAIGVPGEDLGPSVDAGAVNVLYGAAGGLNTNDDQFLSQDSSAILDAAELADFFGQSLAGGDFNGDGFADLVVGVPREAIGSTHDAGAVHVIYGSQIGLSPVSIPGLPSTGHNNQFFSQETDGVPDFAEEKDRFGTTLAAGDFDGDLADDLALGTPGEDLGAATNAGAVSVLYGSTGATSGGLSATGSQTHQQGAGGVLDTAEALDNFGFALAAGNFDGDTFDDLAVGVPNESLETISSAGAVNALYGSSSRLGGGQQQFFNQDTPGVEGGAEPGDFFGAALTAWNFGKGDPSDLAIGVPQEAIGTIQSAGAVNVLYGKPRTRAPGGLIVEGNQVWHQDVPEILEAAEFSDRFGQALY